MNFLKFGSVSVAFVFAGCNALNTPVSSTSFDPLGAPSSSIPIAESSYGPELAPGQFVTATIPNTAFYKKKPGANQDADKLLKKGANMKIVSVDSSFVKVELDSGEVGFVPSVMVSAAATETDVAPLDDAYQVYPPLSDADLNEPLPIVDPSGLPPDDSIPTIIDPTAPLPDPTIPTLDEIPDIKEDIPEKVEEPKTEEELDPVAEAVRKKLEAARAEEEAEAKAADALKKAADKAE